MLSRSRRIGWLATAVFILVTCGAVTHPTLAGATTTCSLAKDGRKLGTTYVTSLKVTGVTCAGGKRVVKAFNACRRASGGVRGGCTRRVLGYRCTERRQSIPTQFASRATCKNGSRVARFSYTQFT